MRKSQPASKQKGETIARNRREESQDSPAPAGDRQKTKEIRLVVGAGKGPHKVFSVLSSREQIYQGTDENPPTGSSPLQAGSPGAHSQTDLIEVRTALHGRLFGDLRTRARALSHHAVVISSAQPVLLQLQPLLLQQPCGDSSDGPQPGLAASARLCSATAETILLSSLILKPIPLALNSWAPLRWERRQREWMAVVGLGSSPR